jgi:hypothetical protein
MLPIAARVNPTFHQRTFQAPLCISDEDRPSSGSVHGPGTGVWRVCYCLGVSGVVFWAMIFVHVSVICLACSVLLGELFQLLMSQRLTRHHAHHARAHHFTVTILAPLAHHSTAHHSHS